MEVYAFLAMTMRTAGGDVAPGMGVQTPSSLQNFGGALQVLLPSLDEGASGRWPSTAFCTLEWITTAAVAAVARQNRPTKGKLPRDGITPPREAPPTAPSWLLTAKSPVAVARDWPASSVNSTAVTGQIKGNKPATPQANTTVAHGERSVVKTRAAPSPPPRNALATTAKRDACLATRPPMRLPAMTPRPAMVRGRAVAPALPCHRVLSGVFSARTAPGLTATITSAGTLPG